MKTRLVWILVLVFLVAGCSERLPERVVNRVLTPEEMAIPPGRYQVGIDMHHTCQVDLDSPEIEPVLRWTVKPEITIDPTDAMVDGEGGVWYNDGPSGWPSNNIVIRLNPDGSKDFEKTLLPKGNYEGNIDPSATSSSELSSISIVRPVVALQGAMVWYAQRLVDKIEYKGTEIISEEYTINSFLECIDTDGHTRWRTESVEVTLRAERIGWRVTENRVMMVTSLTSANIYSLDNGEFLESMEVPGFSGFVATGPIPLPDGGWIFYGNNYRDFESLVPYISRIMPDGTVAWHDNYSQHSSIMPVTLNENGILLRGTWNGLASIDSESGSVFWEKFSFANYPCGVMPNGWFIVSGFDHPNDRGNVRAMTSSGAVLWEIDTMVRGENDVIIYRDNSILIGYQWGISLINVDGSILWTIDLDDLNYTGDDDFSQWRLNPTPDGNIVAIGNTSSDGYHSEIFYLEQAG